jgi:hypothetical protein
MKEEEKEKEEDEEEEHGRQTGWLDETVPSVCITQNTPEPNVSPGNEHMQQAPLVNRRPDRRLVIGGKVRSFIL